MLFMLIQKFECIHLQPYPNITFGSVFGLIFVRVQKSGSENEEKIPACFLDEYRIYNIR